MAIPPFTVSRKTANEESKDDPFATLEFSPPRDSDELFDALRIYYPDLKTHKDRLFRAAIDFFTAEKNTVIPAAPTFLDMNLNSSCSPPPAYSSSETALDLKKPPISVDMKSMLGAFSVIPDNSARTRMKRPMTIKEREEYRHVKRVGACELCRKRKRKVGFQ
jgi:hypothetical protein